MRLQRTAMSAGQAWPPTASAEVSTLVAVSGDGARGISPGRRPGRRAPDAQGHPTPEFPARVSRRAEDGGAGRSGCGRTGRDRPARWLTASMVALAVLAAASAVVSYAAQYRMVLAAKGVAPVAALEAGIPDVGRADLRDPGHRAGAARQAGDPGAGAERGRGGHVGGDERAGRRARLAGPGDLGDAAGRLRAGVGHRDRGGPGLDDRPAEGAERGAGRRRGHAAGDPRRAAAVAAAAGPGARVHAGGVPRAGCSRSARSPPAAARRPDPQPAAAVAPRPGAGDHRPPAPGRPARGARAGTKTARFLALVAERYGPLADVPLADVSRVCAELAPEVGPRPGRGPPALRRHVLALPENGEPRHEVLHCPARVGLLVLAVAAVVLRCRTRRLPRFRVRHLRLRLRLRLHPGRGHATVPSSCGCGGAGSRPSAASGRSRRSLPAWRAAAAARPSTRCSWAGRTTGTGCGCRWRSTCVVMAPPADGQDRAAGQGHPALPRPGGLDHDQARRVRADLRHPVAGAARCTCSTRSRSAACRPRSGGTRSTAAGPGGRDPPRRRVRQRGQP